MGNSLHQPPAGYVSRLRALADNPTLDVEWNEVRSEEIRGPSWSVIAWQKEEPHVVVTWEHPLDGCVDAIATLVRRHDFRFNGGSKAFKAGWWEKQLAAKREKKRRFRDWARAVGDHGRDAFRALYYGDPGARGARV